MALSISSEANQGRTVLLKRLGRVPIVQTGFDLSFLPKNTFSFKYSLMRLKYLWLTAKQVEEIQAMIFVDRELHGTF